MAATDKRREPVQFVADNPEAIALEKTAPFESSYGKWGYWLTGNRIMFLPKDASVLVGNLDPQPGEEFYITKHEVRNGRKARIEWLVTQEPPIATHQPAPNGKPADIAGAAAATGIPETQLERQLRESLALRQKAAANIRAKLALEQRGDAIPPESITSQVQSPAPEPKAARKPAAAETALEPSSSPPTRRSTPWRTAGSMPSNTAT
ncbi:MAG: hypothetical protein LAP40_23505 [Acidobacteriia bacterium]|nr:hypothetical protein [Terriglobia bacterium]